MAGCWCNRCTSTTWWRTSCGWWKAPPPRVLFGAGVGSAFHLLASTLRREVGGIATATRNVVLADRLLATTTAILQPVSGVALVHLLKLPCSTPWVAWSTGLHALAIALWLPVLAIQIRMRNVMVRAQRAGAPVPAAYDRLFHWWTGSAWPPSPSSS